MNKLIQLSFATVLLANTVIAQETVTIGTKKVNTNQIRIGAYIAPNFSWMKPTAKVSDDGNFNVKSKGAQMGFTFGLMADYFFATNYGLVTGLQLNSTGGKIEATNVSATAANDKVISSDFAYKLKYLEIPLALKLRTDPMMGKFRFFAQLGITGGINLSKKASYTVKSFDDTSGAVSVTKSNIKLKGSIGSVAPILFSMNIGIGADYKLNDKLSAYAGLFYNNGFLPDATKPNLYDASYLGYYGSFKDANTRLNNFAIRLGIFF